MKNNEKDIPTLMNSLMNSPQCEICQGTGWEQIEETTEEIERMYGKGASIQSARPCPYCNGGHIQKVKYTRERANIPSAYYESNLSSFNWSIYQDNQCNSIDLSKQKKIVESFINQYDIWEKKGIGLYIYSHMKGSGKTFLASCICNELINRNPVTTKFVSASELIDIQKKGLNNASSYESDLIGLLCNCKLLCIDDLGQKQVGTDWTNDILFRIMDSRMNQKLVTIITSNIPIQELQIDDRIVDRINNICSPIPLPEFCIRSKEAKQKKIELFQELEIIKGHSA